MDVRRTLQDMLFCLFPARYQEIMEKGGGGISDGIFSIVTASLASACLIIFTVLKPHNPWFSLAYLTAAFSLASVLFLALKAAITGWAYSRFSASKIPIGTKKLFYQFSLPFSSISIFVFLLYSITSWPWLSAFLPLFLGIAYYKFLALKTSLPDLINTALAPADNPKSVWLRLALLVSDLLLVPFIALMWLILLLAFLANMSFVQ